jgi:XdhC/CoxI family protein
MDSISHRVGGAEDNSDPGCPPRMQPGHYRIARAALADDLTAFSEEDVLAAALGTEARYVAFVGSRRKADVLKAQIAEQGLASDRIARLKAPAGLDIHGIEPEEIALSILAEIVAFRRASVKDVGVSHVIEKATRSCCG